MEGAGTPRSSADVEVHLPVPFWPAASSTTSTKLWPVTGSFCFSTSAVISIRKLSSSPWFHCSKMAAHSATLLPSTVRSTWYASQMTCMSAYSMPLCTIFT